MGVEGRSSGQEQGSLIFLPPPLFPKAGHLLNSYLFLEPSVSGDSCDIDIYINFFPRLDGFMGSV